MVHVFCLGEKCRKIIHLDDHKHWNYEGAVVCQRCRTEIKVEIDDGVVKSSKKTEND